MQAFTDLLVRFFEFIHSGIAGVITDPNFSYGIAIIVFTVIIKVILFPLNVKQINSTTKMSAIQPEMKKLQDKYKNDPQRAQQEIMKLYKENGVNPLGGCLPMLIQMPILIALFAVFKNMQSIEGVRFLWIADLSQPDKFYILPVLSALTTFFSSKLMQPAGDSAQSKQTSTMNIGMSIFLGVMSLSFRGALVLYWVVNNILQIAQTLIMKKINENKKKAENL